MDSTRMALSRQAPEARSTRMALSRQAPEARPKTAATAGTSSCMPSRPKMTLGMPLSSSMAEVAAVRSLGAAALERKTAVKRPIGMPMMMAPKVP